MRDQADESKKKPQQRYLNILVTFLLSQILLQCSFMNGLNQSNGFGASFSYSYIFSLVLLSHHNNDFPTSTRHWLHVGPTSAMLVQRLPSKYETLTQCQSNVGPASATLVQHYPNSGSTCRVCWTGPWLYFRRL